MDETQIMTKEMALKDELERMGCPHLDEGLRGFQRARHLTAVRLYTNLATIYFIFMLTNVFSCSILHV